MNEQQSETESSADEPNDLQESNPAYLDENKKNYDFKVRKLFNEGCPI